MLENSSLVINGNAFIEYGADIVLNKNSVMYVNDNLYLNCRATIRCYKTIKIGRDVLIGNDLDMRDGDGHILNGVLKNKEVVIEDHVWVGHNVRILKGVTLYKDCFIGAGSLVTKNVPEKCMALGYPAEVVKKDIVWER